MNLAKFTTDRGLAVVSNRSSPFDLLEDDHQETRRSSRPKVASRPTPETKRLVSERSVLENRVREAQLTNRRVYQAQQVLTTVTEAMGQLEELLSQIGIVEGNEYVLAPARESPVGAQVGVTEQLWQTQQGVGQLQDQFEETTSDWMVHLLRSNTEGTTNFPLIREMDLAEQTQKRIRQQIADDSSSAVQVQADHISTQTGLLLS